MPTVVFFNSYIYLTTGHRILGVCSSMETFQIDFASYLSEYEIFLRNILRRRTPQCQKMPSEWWKSCDAISPIIKFADFSAKFLLQTFGCAIRIDEHFEQSWPAFAVYGFHTVMKNVDLDKCDVIGNSKMLILDAGFLLNNWIQYKSWTSSWNFASRGWGPHWNRSHFTVLQDTQELTIKIYRIWI